MAIIFKYKNPINVSYAPGFVKGGTNGRQGAQGVTGNALYFVDYELDNSYNVELALQRIEKGYVLGSTSMNKIENYRKYKVNDLILTGTGKIYRLIPSTTDSTFKNYKYDFEYLGPIKKKSSPAVLKVVFTDITGKTIDGVNYNSIQYSPFPLNRSTTDGSDILYEPTSSSNSTPKEKEYFPSDSQIYKMRGKWYQIELIGTVSSIDAFYRTDRNIAAGDPEKKDLIDELIKKIDTASISPCRYSLQLHLKNTKQYQLDFPPDAEITTQHSTQKTNWIDYTTMNFYKVLEFNRLNMRIDDSIKATMTPEQQEEDERVSQYLDEYKTIVYISDYMLDRYHLFDNNLQCTINSDKTMWYKTGLYAEDGIFTASDFSLGPSVIPGSITDNDEENEGDEEQEESSPRYVCDDTVDEYEKSNNFIETTKPRTTSNGVEIESNRPTVEGFPKYAMGIKSRDDAYGNSLILNDDRIPKYEITNHAADTNANVFIRENKNNPLRSGDNAFFSSITDDNACITAIETFMKNIENIAMVTSKNLANGESLVTEVPIEIK